MADGTKVNPRIKKRSLPINYNTKLLHFYLTKLKDCNPKLSTLESPLFSNEVTATFCGYVGNGNMEEVDISPVAQEMYDARLALDGIVRQGEYRALRLPHQIMFSINIDQNDVDWKFLDKEFNWNFNETESWV